MTLPVWPAALMGPLVQGYAEAAGETRRMFQAEQGTPRVRRRSSLVAVTTALTIRVEDADRARFWRFYNEIIGQGSDAFAMPDSGRDGLVLTDEDDEVLTDENGIPLLHVETWLALIGNELPSERGLGAGIWDISFNISVMP